MIVTGWAVLAAGLVAAAVCGLLSAPSRRLRSAPAADRVRVPSWLRARPGAPPVRDRWVAGAALGLVVGVAVGWQAGMPAVGLGVTVVVTVAGAALAGRRESAEHRRERQALVRELPQAYELLSACLDAGLAPRQALAVVCEVMDGPVAVLLTTVRNRMELGEAEQTAWRTLADHPVLGRAARDLARSAEHGLPVAAVLVEHAADARRGRRAAQEEAAKAVGVRAVLPLMCCYLPAFFLIGIVPVVAGALLGILAAFR